MVGLCSVPVVYALYREFYVIYFFIMNINVYRYFSGSFT